MPAPPQLEPLVAVLPTMGQETLELCLKAAALHLQKRDGEIDAAAVKASLAACGIDGSPRKILGACNYLLKQAGKGGGASASKLAGSLGPLGFEEHHIAAILAILEWAKTSPNLATAPEPAPEAPAPAPAPRRAKKEKPAPAPAAAAVAGEKDEGPVRTLHWASISGDAAKVTHILDQHDYNGELMNEQDARGYSAYHHACANGHAAVVELLVRLGL